MSRKVDVLKAMRVAEAYCYDAGASNAAKNLRAAADAVAELIEQRDTLLNALKRALPHVEHAYHTHEDLDGSFWIDVVGCRSALARAHGVQS